MKYFQNKLTLHVIDVLNETLYEYRKSSANIKTIIFINKFSVKLRDNKEINVKITSVEYLL